MRTLRIDPLFDEFAQLSSASSYQAFAFLTSDDHRRYKGNRGIYFIISFSIDSMHPGHSRKMIGAMIEIICSPTPEFEKYLI